MDAQAPHPLVVKIGGSLVETGRLAGALDMIAAATRAVVVVPGGGAFADKVRDLQRALKFADAAAHRMAMLGMRQMADFYISMRDEFAVADSLDAIAATLASGKTPVWDPRHMAAEDETIPANWTATSDALAARLAERHGGAPLVLIKSIDVDEAATAADLAADGIVDQAFPVIVARARLNWRVVGPGGEAVFREMLAGAPASAPMHG